MSFILTSLYTIMGYFRNNPILLNFLTTKKNINLYKEENLF